MARTPNHLKYRKLLLIHPIPDLVVLGVRKTHRLISFTHVTKSITADQLSDVEEGFGF